ncbi:Energy-coupling factor transporter ATP-binding protein [Trichinella spiralis]|uniref:Energy-coupling factor transporter ATP-binding protein n=1 Tax=Trichinella spiralis TaxID=6334 RepID=A0ABR3KVU8_TRISP
MKISSIDLAMKKRCLHVKLQDFQILVDPSFLFSVNKDKSLRQRLTELHIRHFVHSMLLAFGTNFFRCRLGKSIYTSQLNARRCSMDGRFPNHSSYGVVEFSS